MFFGPFLVALLACGSFVSLFMVSLSLLVLWFNYVVLLVYLWFALPSPLYVLSLLYALPSPLRPLSSATTCAPSSCHNSLNALSSLVTSTNILDDPHGAADGRDSDTA